MRILLLKNFYKIAQRNGYIYSPFIKLAVGLRQQKKSAVGRPPSRPANGQISDRCASGRPPGRSGLDTESSSSLPVDRGHFQRAELSGRSTDPVDRPPALAACTSCARRSIGPVDQLLLRSTGLVDR